MANPPATFVAVVADDTDPPVVAKVPEVGKVTLVVPVIVNVVPNAPDIVNVDAALLAIPVPPYAGPITDPFHVPLEKVPPETVPDSVGPEILGLVPRTIEPEPVVVLPNTVIIPVTAGIVMVELPNAPVVGDNVIDPEVALLNIAVPTDEPATPCVILDVADKVVNPPVFGVVEPIAPGTAQFTEEIGCQPAL